MNTILSSVGLVTAALSFGSLGWFFFVQTPVLAKRLGRDRFVPLQMSLVRPLFTTVALASVVLVVVSLVTELSHLLIISAAVSLVLALLAATVVVPRALRAGGRSLAQSLPDEAQHSAGRFAADGGGDASRWWHRALVLVTVGVVAAQVTWLVAPRGTEAAHAHPALHARTRADPATTDGVRHLRALVAGALTEGPQNGALVGAALQQAYADIFTHCTMTGDAHATLHGYLAPMGDMLATLTAATEPAATRVQLERLRAQLDRWDSAFE